MLDQTGAPIDGGALVFSFALYTSATGGTALWTEEQSITPDQGYFSARLGETAPFPTTLFDGSQGTLFLGITVGSDSEMAPRQQLTSTPFAMLALNAVQATHALSAESANGALNTRITALETAVAKLTAAQKTYGGSFFKGNATCGDTVTTPCTADISGGGFTQAPVCVVTMTNIDATGYTEKMVVKGTTTTTLSVWRGQFNNAGSTMSGFFVCSGN